MATRHRMVRNRSTARDGRRKSGGVLAFAPNRYTEAPSTEGTVITVTDSRDERRHPTPPEQPDERAGTIESPRPAAVTNPSALPPPMRAALPEARDPTATFYSARRNVAGALQNRGLAVLVGDGEARLTDKGARGREMLRYAVPDIDRETELYHIITGTNPIIGDVARQVAHLRRWAACPADDDYHRGMHASSSLVPDQLVEPALRPPAPLVMPEATRRDDAFAARQEG